MSFVFYVQNTTLDISVYYNEYYDMVQNDKCYTKVFYIKISLYKLIFTHYHCTSKKFTSKFSYVTSRSHDVFGKLYFARKASAI